MIACLDLGIRQVQTIDELRKCFYTEHVLECYFSERLLRWLKLSGYDNEARRVCTVKLQCTNVRDVLKELSDIFHVEIPELEDDTLFEDYLKGLNAYYAKDYEVAEKYLVNAADEYLESICGAPQYTLGKMYGLQENYKKALSCFREAANQGHAHSCYIVAVALAGGSLSNDVDGFCGINISKAGGLNPQEAGDYFIKAAEKGHTCGLLFAGMGYLEGEYGIEKDCQMARKYFLQASEQGNPSAMCNLIKMLKIGCGGEKNIDEARKWELELENTVKMKFY